MRAQMMSYATAGPVRPGLVTAIGITSIVVGSIGIVTALLFIMYAGGLLFVSLQGPKIFAGMAAAITGAVMPQAERQAIVQIIATPQWPMSPKRKIVLEAFLHDNGRQLFPIRVMPPPPGLLTGRGTYPGPGSSTIDYILFKNGRLDVGDDFAAWYPGVNAIPAPQNKPLGLTAQEAQAASAQLQKVSMRTLPPATLAIFVREMGSPQQKFVTAGADIKSQIVGALATPSNGDVVHSSNGSLFYLPAANPVLTATGGYASSTVVVLAPAPATAPATQAFPPPPPPGPSTPVFPSVSPIAPALAVLEAVASLGLSIFLLVIGIQIFRWSRRGRRHHLIFAWTKLILTAVFVIAWSIAIFSFASAMNTAFPVGATPAPPFGGMRESFLMTIVFFAILAAIYPIALLFTLRARSVRIYYEQIGA